MHGETMKFPSLSKRTTHQGILGGGSNTPRIINAWITWKHFLYETSPLV